MAITVVCSGCQSQYQVPDSSAGKRAKCKKCGAVLEVPALAADDGLTPLDDAGGMPALTPLPLPKPQASAQPQPLRKPAANPYADNSLDDIMSLSASSPAPAALGAPVKHASPLRPAGAKQGGSGASIGAAIAATLLTLCATGVMFFALLCTGDWIIALVAGVLGVLASIGCCVLGIMRKPGLSWGTFAAYSALCLLGIGKAGYNVYLVPTRIRELAEKQRQEEEARRGNWPPTPNRTWSPPTPGGQTPGTNPSGHTPGTTPFQETNRPTPAPWIPPTKVPEDIKQPRTDDWKVTLDAPPEWAQVGEGRDFSIVLDEPGWTPIRHASGYAKAIGFQHQLGGQEVFEVWDLNKRKKVGQLKGKNGFKGESALSPDGKFIAGEVEGERGAWHGPLQVWSITAGQKVCEIPSPTNDRSVDILDYASPETLLAVYRRGERNQLKVWNISDGSEKQSIDLGDTHIDRRRYALSPGRKYFVTFQDQTLRFYDLTLGTEQGVIYLPSSYRCEALTFSPDGTEFAALCNADWKATMLVWQTQTGEMKSQVKLEQDTHSLLNSADKTGGMPIGWLGTEGWVCGGSQLVSRKDGKVIWKLEKDRHNDVPAKLLDKDQMIDVERHGNSMRVSLRAFPYGEMDSVNKALAAGGAAIDAKLPPLGKGDWSSVKELDWTTGVPWTATPDPRLAMKAGSGNKQIALTAERLVGLAFSSPTQAQVVALDVDQRSPEYTFLDPQVASYLSRFDLQTGKSVARQKVPGGSDLLAVSPSGQRVALSVGIDDARIDIYTLAERSAQFCAWRPYNDESSKTEGELRDRHFSRQSVQWAGFIGEDHLLTMNRLDGQLVLWKVPEMKAVYRLRTGSISGGQLSPNGKYLLVRCKDRFVLVESMTGQLAGELPLPFETLNNTTNVGAAFSPDGQRVAATLPDVGSWFLFAYDMKTGKEMSRLPVHTAFNLQWCGPRQLLIGGERNSGGDVHLLDLDRRATVWRYNVYSGYRLGSPPDDRVWLIAGGHHNSDAVLVAQPFQLSSEVTTAVASLPFNPPPLFGPGTTVSLDASNVGSAGGPDLSERVKQAWSTNLTARGARVGEGGLKLVASTSSGTSRTEEYTPQRFGFPFPGRSSQQPAQGNFSFTSTDINLSVQLQDASGKKLWESKSVASYGLPYSVQSNSQDKSPQQVMAESQASTLKSQTEGFFLGVRLPFMIFPQPTDKNGQPGLGTSSINLSGYVNEHKGPRPVDAATAGNKESMEAMYAKILADNTDISSNHWQWCQGVERPIVALRWGLGVQMDLKSDRAKVELQPQPVDSAILRDLEKAAGPIGPALVQMLRAKQSEGKFGTFADVGDDTMREVMLLGTGERPQLAAAARKAAVDLVMIIKLEPLVKGRQRDAQLSLEVLDLASGKKLWASETLLESRVQAAKANDQDLLTELSDKMSAEIDTKLALTPIATMPNGTAALRAEASSLHRANPLAALCEIDLYLCRDQIPAPTASAAFAKVLGNTTDAADLASEDPKTRDAAIEKVVPMLVDKMQ